MTPRVPRGSETGSPPTISSPTGPQETAPPRRESTSRASVNTDSFRPFRLSLEGSYLISGEGGFPLRVGLLGLYRPVRPLGLGLRLDSNFSDEANVALRAQGILTLSRQLSVFAAAEAGARILFGQRHVVDEVGRSLSGALANFGIELGLDIQVHPQINLGIFGRLSLAPAGALSAAEREPNPPSGISAGGHEIVGGIRVGWTPRARASGPRERRPSPVSPRMRGAHEAIRRLEQIVEDIQDHPERAVSPSAEAPSTQGLETLRTDLRSLRESHQALEGEIAASIRIYRSLQQGQDAGTEFRMRLDRIEDALASRPPRMEPSVIENFLRELTAALSEDQNLRLLAQSSSENFGPSLLEQLQAVRTNLQTLQNRLPTTPRPSEGPARASLDPVFPLLSGAIATLEDLRRRPNRTQPSTEQIARWRERIANLETQIGELAPGLNAEQREQLETAFAELNEGFGALTLELDRSERFWLVTRATTGHYRTFQSAERPEQAAAALRAMHEEFERIPAPDRARFRTLYRRGMENFRIDLNDFVSGRSSGHRSSPAREAAIQILQWIDPAYLPPPMTPARPSRPRPRAVRPARPRQAPVQPATPRRTGPPQNPPAPTPAQPAVGGRTGSATPRGGGTAGASPGGQPQFQMPDFPDMTSTE